MADFQTDGRLPGKRFAQQFPCPAHQQIFIRERISQAHEKYQVKKSIHENLYQEISNKKESIDQDNQTESDNNSKDADNCTDRCESEIHQEIQKCSTDTESIPTLVNTITVINILTGTL